VLLVEQHLVAPAPDGLAEHGLRRAVRIDVGGVEQRDPGIEADVHQAAGFLQAGIAPIAEERAASAERAGAEAQRGHAEAGCAQASIFHLSSVS
jgi:hypothetical protein